MSIKWYNQILNVGGAWNTVKNDSPRFVAEYFIDTNSSVSKTDGGSLAVSDGPSTTPQFDQSDWLSKSPSS